MQHYPSIESFKSACDNVKKLAKSTVDIPDNTDLLLPILRYRGTIKLHGTHADIVKSENKIHYQSRNHIITPENDNCKFATTMESYRDIIEELFKQIEVIKKDIQITQIMIAGEWCGNAIQKGVAISQLAKFYVIFGVKINDVWYDIKQFDQLKHHPNRIYNILDFEHYYLDIDFNDKSKYQNILIDYTNCVEKECPVGKYFGISGVGEGVVWCCLDPVDPHLTFKVKGAEHSVTRVKKLVEIDLELEADINKLCDMVASDNRMQQGLDYMREHNIDITIAHVSDFVKWVLGDVAKEETERIEQSGFADKAEKNKFFNVLSKKAITYYKKYILDL